MHQVVKLITITSTKLELMHSDHQSEHITFEIPRFIDGHDISLSDCIKIHYINTENYNYTA